MMNHVIVKKPYPNCTACGDECACWESPEQVVLCIADGLGHGIEAEIAAKSALEYIGNHLKDSIADIFSGCNSALKKTRGAAVGLTIIDKIQGTLTYCGIGNTRILITGSKLIRFSSNYGIVGAGYRKITPETIPLPNTGLVMMYSDGIHEMFDPTGYQSNHQLNLLKLAEIIMRDYSEDRDDAAIIIFKL